MNIEQLEARLNTLENKLRTFEDIEAIKKLQRSYGYYIEHMMYNEVAELWTDDGELTWLGWGTFKGKEAIKNCWKIFREDNPPEYLHMAIQLSPIIDVDPEGKTAKGRWYCLGGMSSRTRDENGQTTRGFFWVGVDENEYVKQNGVWKIKVFQYNIVENVTGVDVVLSPEQLARVNREMEQHMNSYGFTVRSDAPESDFVYSGYITPFHFKHPVTGKTTSERDWNASLKKTRR